MNLWKKQLGRVPDSVWERTDPLETSRLMTLFFPNLVGGGAAPNLATWINKMDRVAAANYDMEQGTAPWAPSGLLTEFPYF
jgi:hypothetical protein